MSWKKDSYKVGKATGKNKKITLSSVGVWMVTATGWSQVRQVFAQIDVQQHFTSLVSGRVWFNSWSPDTGTPPSAPRFTWKFNHFLAHILDLLMNVPDVAHHNVGAALQGPGGEGQLDMKLLHVPYPTQGRQSVWATPQQEVTKGGLSRWHVRREERVLHLENGEKAVHKRK